MRYDSLVKDYVSRASDRIDALALLYTKKSWANVVKEAQKIVELAFNAYLRHLNIEAPRIHDVSPILLENKELLTQEVAKSVDKICDISRSLRRDRELAYCGAEDLTPSEFYTENDARQAKEQAGFVLNAVKSSI